MDTATDLYDLFMAHRCYWSGFIDSDVVHRAEHLLPSAAVGGYTVWDFTICSVLRFTKYAVGIKQIERPGGNFEPHQRGQLISQQVRACLSI